MTSDEKQNPHLTDYSFPAASINTGYYLISCVGRQLGTEENNRLSLFTELLGVDLINNFIRLSFTNRR